MTASQRSSYSKQKHPREEPSVKDGKLEIKKKMVETNNIVTKDSNKYSKWQTTRLARFVNYWCFNGNMKQAQCFSTTAKKNPESITRTLHRTNRRFLQLIVAWKPPSVQQSEYCTIQIENGQKNLNSSIYLKNKHKYIPSILNKKKLWHHQNNWKWQFHVCNVTSKIHYNSQCMSVSSI